MPERIILSLIFLCSCPTVSAQVGSTRTLSGLVLSQQNEAAPGVTILVRYPSGEQKGESDAEGNFRLVVPNEPLTVQFSGKSIEPLTKNLGATEPTENLHVRITYVVPPIHESVVIQAATLNPAIDRRNDAVYKGTLFSRDDQLFQTRKTPRPLKSPRRTSIRSERPTA